MHRPTQAVRLSTYATLAAGTTVAGSAAIADVIIVDLGVPRDTTEQFNIDLFVAGSGGTYVFQDRPGARITASVSDGDPFQGNPLFVATGLVGTNALLDSNSV